MKIKINSMETNSNLSDDEIRSYMNFDKIAEQARIQSARRRMRYWWIALPVALALVSVWLVIDNDQHGQGRATQLIEAKKNDASTADARKPPEDKFNPGSGQATTASSTKEPGEPKASDTNKAGADGSRTEAEKAAAERPVTAHVQTSPPPVKDTYVQAEPRQGYAHLYAYFGEHLMYPPIAVKDSVEGIETVSFTIDERGKPTHISITNSLGVAFDQEAIRLIREMPDWSPATLNGRPVASQLSVPLTFQLKRIKKP